MDNTWKTPLASFLQNVGLYETMRFFEAELLVLPSDKNRIVQRAAGKLVEELGNWLEHGEELGDPQGIASKQMRLPDASTVQIRAGKGEVQKRIAAFMEAKQSEINASNREEFLLRRREKESKGTSSEETSARTEAAEINRTVQMKLEIVHNEDGPLDRSVAASHSQSSAKSGTAPTATAQIASPSHTILPTVKSENIHLPAIPDGAVDIQLKNLEEHLAIRYVPISNLNISDRLRSLEDHIMKLEREHPPWTAVYFNQPNRTVPGPPPTVHYTKNSSGTMVQVSNPNMLNGNGLANPRVYRGDPNSSMARSIQEQLSKARQREQEHAAAKRAQAEADAKTVTEGTAGPTIAETEKLPMVPPPPPPYPPPFLEEKEKRKRQKSGEFEDVRKKAKTASAKGEDEGEEEGREEGEKAKIEELF